MFDRLDLPSFEKTVELRASKSVAAIIDDITPRSFKILRLDTVCPTDSWASLASWSSVPSPEEEFAWFDCRDGRDYPIGFWSEERKFFARNGAVGAESSAANSGRSGDSCRFLNPFREHNKMLELWKGRLFCTRMCEETPRILLPLRQAKDHAYNLPLTDVFEKCIDESLARISVTSAYSVATRLF